MNDLHGPLNHQADLKNMPFMAQTLIFMTSRAVLKNVGGLQAIPYKQTILDSYILSSNLTANYTETTLRAG